MGNFVFQAALGLYAIFAAILVISLAVSSSSLAHARLSLWTNLFYLWPTVRALFLPFGVPGATSYPAAWGEASVFFVTFVASSIHHGCSMNSVIRETLASETYWVLWIGSIVVLFAVAMTTSSWISRVNWTTNSHICILLPTIVAAVASVIGFALLLHQTHKGQLDGCVWLHDSPDADYEANYVPALVSIWDSVDYVTAFSALIVAVLFIVQATGTMTLAVFWPFAVFLLVLRLYAEMLPSGPSQGNIFGKIILGGVFFFGCQVALCCSYPRYVRTILLQSYDWIDFTASVLVGGTAIVLFVADNNAAVHSIWHALGALALYFAVESLYRKHSLFAASFLESSGDEDQV